jgi:uncharacterized MnhB-related membrane protein
VTALQLTALIIVVVTGTAVALTPVPIRQALVLSIYGFALMALFFSFQAPDVALSEIVVGGVALPIVILAALRRIAEEQDQRRSTADSDQGEANEDGQR